MTRITIKDIAQAAGASTALVSFVLNGKGKEHRVSDRMIEHITQVAQELHYQPNASAKALREGRTNTIGVIVSDISNPFFSEIVRKLEDLAFEQGISVLFGSSDEHPAKMESLIRVLRNKGVDGWIIVPCQGAEATIRELAEGRDPVILLERDVKELQLPTVCLDNAMAGKMTVEHLLQRGYQRIHVLSYELPILSLQQREDAYRLAMQEAGFAQHIKVHQLPFKLPQGTNGFQYLESMVPLLGDADALICLTARLSQMCLKAFRRAGIQLPQDLALIGFDAGGSFELLEPSLTYIRQDVQAFADDAFAMLREAMLQGHTRKQVIQIAPELVEGSSTLRKNDRGSSDAYSLKEKFVNSLHRL